MKKNSLAKQIFTILLVIALFVSFNLSIYALLTMRLANNFSDTSQAKMIDVSQYLPFEENSDLPNVKSSFKLTDNLPVLDGAAALVPVYASIIHNIYPKGCVTYDGGEFSDDNFYGENFATDSKMQYKNTVRGYQAIVDGDTDILFCAAPSAEQKAYAEEKAVSDTDDSHIGRSWYADVFIIKILINKFQFIEQNKTNAGRFSAGVNYLFTADEIRQFDL